MPPPENQANERALDTIKQSLDLAASLPNQMFRGPWAQFLFLDIDTLFQSTFAGAVRSLLRGEGSRCACLLNLSSSGGPTISSPDVFYFVVETPEAEYQQCLLRNQAAWMVLVDDFACASDGGEWCIYCEKANEVAIVALRSPNASLVLRDGLDPLDAQPLEALLARGQEAPYPYSRLVPAWREGLLANYSFAPACSRALDARALSPRS